jgi:predicted RND superfamily exporter protein
MSRAEAWVERVIGARRWLLVLVALTTGLSLFGAAGVGVDNAVEIWFLDDDPSLLAYDDFLDTFGNDEVVIIGVHATEGTLIEPSGLSRIRAVGDAALGVDGIARVRSIVTEPLVRDVDGALVVAPLIDGGAVGPDQVVEAQRALQNDALVGSMISEDGRTAIVLAEMDSMDDIDTARDGILANLQTAVRAVENDASFAGIGVVYAALNQAATKGAAVVILASYVLITALLWLLFRRFRAVLLTLSVVGLGAIWLLGLYGATGHDINMVTMVMPTLVLVIGVSDCVHMLVHVADQPMDLPPIERVKRGIGKVLWPCLFNTLTTAMGFLALATASMPVIRDLGIFCALGLVAAFVASLILCSIFALSPTVLPVFRQDGVLQRGINGMANLAVGKPIPVLVVAGFVCLGSMVGVTRIVVDTYSIDFLYPDHEARVDSDRLEEEFGPYTPLEFVVAHPDGVKDPEILASIARWQDKMELEEDVGWTRSLADVVMGLDRVMGQRKVGVVPENSEALEQLLFLFDADVDSNLSRFLDSTETQTRVTVGVPMTSAKTFGERIERLTEHAEFPEGTTVQPAGYIPLYVKIMDHIISSQLSSFTLAFVVIFTLIGLLFRSFRMAMLAIPANLIPVLFTLGCMGLVGIRLDVATVTIAAIVLGLVVDDTTQFLYRYRTILSETTDISKAVKATVASVGRPMAVTTLVLAGGFSVLGLADIKSVAYFGVLLAISLIAAFFCDLLVIPALIVVTARR